MEKSLITNFISKYHLKGDIESVKWVVEKNSLKTKFISDCKICLGSVSLLNFKFENTELGIYHTKNLLKILMSIGDDVTISLEKKNNILTSIVFDDGISTANYVLSDLKNIPEVPDLKKLPEWDVKITLDKDLMSRYIKSINAIDSESTTFMSKNDNDYFNIIVGYSSLNTNRITIKTGSKTQKKLKPISFSSSYVKSIFAANLDSENSKLSISKEGLLYFEFDSGDYKSEYYLVAIK